MKKIITLFMTLSVILLAHSQPSPALSGVYCPGVPITFHDTLPGGPNTYNNVTVTGTSNTGITGSQAVQVTSNVSISYPPNSTVVTFTGMFADWAAPQGILIGYTDINGNPQSIPVYHYDKIASFHTTNTSGSIPQPSPTSIQASLCQSQSFNITVPNISYWDIYTNPTLQYGTVSSYQYLLPAGWQLGLAVSDGVTWLTGTGSVTVTSDASTGGSIQVRGAACGANLTPGPATTIAISRPAPTLSVGSTGSGAFCTGDARVFSVNGLPSGATVAWSVQPAGIVTINSPNASQTTLTKTGDDVITLTATVTACGNTYTVNSVPITIGAPTPTILSTNYVAGFHFTAVANTIPGATYNWYLNNVLLSSHSNNASGDVTCNTSNPLKVGSVTTCGSSPISHALSIYIPCGGGGQSVTQSPQAGTAAALPTGQDEGAAQGSSGFTISPNPSSGIIRLTAVAAANMIHEVRVVDLLGKVRRVLHYSKGVTDVNIDLSGLNNGVYILQVSDKVKWVNLRAELIK